MFRNRLAYLQFYVILLMLMPIGPQFAWSDSAEKPDAPKSAYTDDVLKIAYGYEDGGGYIWKNSTGVCESLIYDDKTILKKQPKGTYCCGFTLQVAFKLALQRGVCLGDGNREARDPTNLRGVDISASGETPGAVGDCAHTEAATG